MGAAGSVATPRAEGAPADVLLERHIRRAIEEALDKEVLAYAAADAARVDSGGGRSGGRSGRAGAAEATAAA